MQKRKAIVAIGAGALLSVAAAGLIFTEDRHHEGREGNHERREASSFTQAQASAAREAALRAVGGGEVISIESEGKKGRTYEVEVVKGSGSRVDVLLGTNYKPLSVKPADKKDSDDDRHSAPDSDD